MKRNSHLYLAVIVSLAILILGSPLFLASSASSPTTGYVTYQATMTKQGSPTYSFLINESSSGTNQNGLVTLSLSVISNLQNLTYSRVVNMSTIPEVFPYLPGITNQSFSYDTRALSIHAQISTAGTGSVTFMNARYTAQKYLIAFTFTNSSSGKTVSASGTLLTLPSDLVYSVQVQEAGSSASATVQLYATNLSLDPPSNSVSATEGAALVGAGIFGAAALAIPWKLKSNKKNNPSSENSEKPSYWVD